jgi:putative zinc finger protein
MDHAYIQEHQIVSQYLMGKLQPADRVQFEDHLVDCPQCLDETELTDDFRRALRNLMSQRESRISARTGLATWLAGFQRREIVLSAAAVLIVATLISFFVVGQKRRFERELDQARLDSSTWERRYNDEHQARTNAESQLRETPADAAPLFTLNLTRSANLNTDAPSNAISIPREAKLIILSLELQNDPEFQSYRATLTDAAGNRVWGSDRIIPPSSAALALILPASVIPAGKYVLSVEGQRAGQYSVVGNYSFRAAFSN